MATKTFTFPASQVYVDSQGISHTVTTGQAMKFEMTDLGTTAKYQAQAASETVACTDGFTFDLEADPNYAFWCTADDTATDEEGTLCIVEEDGKRVVCNIPSLKIDDADSPSLCTIKLEPRENSANVFTWTDLTVA